MKKHFVMACIAMVLAAPSAHSDNIFDKLTNAAQESSAEQSERFPGAMVLTIDGMDKNMLGGGLLGLLAKGATTGRGDSYLVEPIKENWRFADDVRYYAWSGDPAKASADLQNLKTQIVGLSELASRRGKPFVIVAHSWGSVLAYRAISELKSEGKLPGPNIRKLITIGSPLGTNCSATDVKCALAREETNKHVNLSGPQAILGPVESWTNFWIKKDNISGPVDGLSDNIELKYSFANPHQAYYSNSNLLGKITDLVANDLASFVSATQVAGVPPESDTSIPMPTPSIPSTDTVASQNLSTQARTGRKGLDLYGLKLGMTYGEASSVIRGRLPGIYSEPRPKPSDVSELVVIKRAREELRRSGGKELIESRGSCVNTSLGTDHCVLKMTVKDYAQVTPINLEVSLIEDVASSPGTTVVHSVRFYQSAERIEPFKAVQSKYGAPVRDNGFTIETRCKEIEVKPGRCYPIREGEVLRAGQSIVIQKQVVPQTEYYWDVASPIGLGVLAFCQDGSSAQHNRQQVSICSASQGGYALMLELDQKNLQVIEERRDEALKRSAVSDSPF